MQYYLNVFRWMPIWLWIKPWKQWDKGKPFVSNKLYSTKSKPPQIHQTNWIVRTKVELKQTSRNPNVRNSEFKSCSLCGKVTKAVTSTQQKMLCVTNSRVSSQCFSKRSAIQHSVDFSSLNSTPSNDETITFLDNVQTGSDKVWNITVQLNQQQVWMMVSHLSYNICERKWFNNYMHTL